MSFMTPTYKTRLPSRVSIFAALGLLGACSSSHVKTPT